MLKVCKVERVWCMCGSIFCPRTKRVSVDNHSPPRSRPSLKLGAQIKKSYLAVCVGNPGEMATINVPIGRHPNHRQKMIAVPTIQPNIRSRSALSMAKTAAFDGKLSVVAVGIETGRTHQIRVHMQVSYLCGGCRVN